MDDEATLLRVAGTNAEKRILDLQTKGRGARGMATLDILGLFSLDPAALRDALMAGRKEVTRPIQVILFGLKGDYGSSGVEDGE